MQAAKLHETDGLCFFPLVLTNVVLHVLLVFFFLV